VTWAIAGNSIAAVGGKQGPGRREINADGLLLTPGWVDVHTHYDGQAMWDPMLSPSCWHGVTTAMFGNCGVGFAPVHKHHRGALMDLMEGVEEIPNAVLADGLIWDWESFPDFLADLNLIDFDRLRLHQPELVNDMPAGGRRFVQRVDGYESTLVAGTPIFEHGAHTGAMPGHLVRARRLSLTG
jgi:N-acyl-D-aspartate/D-glutamate deacylase